MNEINCTYQFTIFIVKDKMKKKTGTKTMIDGGVALQFGVFVPNTRFTDSNRMNTIK